MASRFFRVLKGASLVAGHVGDNLGPELRRVVLVASQPASKGPLRPWPAPAEFGSDDSSADGDPGAAARGAAAAAQPPAPGVGNVSEPPAAACAAPATAAGADDEDLEDVDPAPERHEWTSVEVPSSSVARAFEFGKLGASIMTSSLAAAARRTVFGRRPVAEAEEEETPGSVVMTEENAERMAATLSKLRGAALKVGQLLSLQDDHAVPKQLQAVFNRVRASAHTMPQAQLHAVLAEELGADWEGRLRSFGAEPIAAASIGQVHRAVLRDGGLVAIKVQYPGVSSSIDADLANLRRLARYTGMVPKRLFLDRIIAFAKEELLAECDYEAEAAHTRRYRALLDAAAAEDGSFSTFAVPRVHEDLSSKLVLTTDWMPGGPIDAVARMSAGRRNAVATKALRLTLRELFEWRFMQTDPNWGNYLYHAPSDTMSLIDFGAAQEYPRAFVDEYLRMVDACARRDREAVVDSSVRMGFLHGGEPAELIDAHVEAALVLGEPFASTKPYDFARSALSTRVRQHVPTMLRLRERPPPAEIYSLHRKLSGAYMLCIRLGATIDCRSALDEVRRRHVFGDERLAHCSRPSATDSGQLAGATGAAS